MRAMVHVIIHDINNIRTNIAMEMFSGKLCTEKLELEHTFELGHSYKITVIIKKPGMNGVEQEVTNQTLSYKETRRKSELQKLAKKAKDFAGEHGKLPVQLAYRNKPRKYFDQILSEDNIMKVYLKSNNGDPGCPANEETKGLFFAVRPYRKTHLPPRSPFGDTRVCLPIQELIKGKKLYFADFWCHDKIHHVPLVVTKPNSEADNFCAENLPQLSVNNNPFIWNEGSNFFCCEKPDVDLLYTEDIDLTDPHIQWETVETIGQGEADPTGIPKKETCETCNLRPDSTSHNHLTTTVYPSEWPELGPRC